MAFFESVKFGSVNFGNVERCVRLFTKRRGNTALFARDGGCVPAQRLAHAQREADARWMPVSKGLMNAYQFR